MRGLLGLLAIGREQSPGAAGAGGTAFRGGRGDVLGGHLAARRPPGRSAMAGDSVRRGIQALSGHTRRAPRR
ncbi:hypothetical protein SCWH03_10560 [Streptomyces pacificus]|uniref:Uncharacterized protein n=1 Tax=Streptomyces pacificus TaxID=2705029 RepID=A0A6A0APR8_9ACTN|nr:hypothetical protein SCWH03_10560 [Streptomyces pacificus]